MAQLLRDNAADSRVLDDVRTLAAAYDDQAVEASIAASEEAHADDLALLAEAFGEAGESTPLWRDVATQVMRYRGWVAAAVAVLAIIVFVAPAPKPLASGDDDGTALIPTADAQHAASDTAEEVVPPTTLADQVDFSLGEALPSFDTAGDTTPTTFGTTPETYAPAPTALRITQSGYSSALGGTPADDAPPQNGLPVETLGGQVTKYSFIRLAGSGASLSLKSVDDPDATLYSPTARIELCHITTANWKPARAASPGDAPKYNAECLEGKAAKGVWTFTFSAVHDPVDPNGWAIVPITADNATFRVTLTPQ